MNLPEITTLNQLTKGTVFTFVGHPAKFEVCDEAVHRDSEVGIMQLSRGVCYDVEGFRQVVVQ